MNTFSFHAWREMSRVTKEGLLKNKNVSRSLKKNLLTNKHKHHYSPLLKRMQLTCTSWEESLKTDDDGPIVRGTHTDPVKNRMYLPLRDFFLFITSLKSNLCTALTTQNITEDDCITWHAQNTTALHRLTVTSKGRSPLASANHSQYQL